MEPWSGLRDSNPLLWLGRPRHNPYTKTACVWGGQRDSNPLQQSGRLRHTPYTMPAWTSVIQLWQGLQESNLRLRIWSPPCCHCTKPLWWAVEDSNLQEPFGHPGYSRGRFRLRANCPWRKVRDSNPRGHKARHRFSRPPHYHSVNLPNGGGCWIRTSERAFRPPGGLANRCLRPTRPTLRVTRKWLSGCGSTGLRQPGLSGGSRNGELSRTGARAPVSEWKSKPAADGERRAA